MYIFKLLTTLLVTLLVTLLLIASFGCDSEAYPWNSDNDDPNNVCQNTAPGYIVSCENNVCKDKHGDVISCNSGKTIGPITVTGKTPDGLPGTFYVEIDICSGEPEKYPEHPFVNVTSFELKMTGFQIQIGRTICIQLIRDKHLFVHYDWEIKDGDKNATFSFDWSAPNSWGLAPNGLYVGLENDEDNIKTYVENKKLFIQGNFGECPVSFNKFSLTNDENYGTVKGTISDDLSSISYHQVYPDGEIRNETLTLK